MTVDPDLWHQVFDRDRGYCRYCDADLLASFSAYCSADVDHLLARSAGGPSTLENLVLACRGCNTSLSRAAHLRTFEERKAYVEAQRAKGMHVYAKLVEKHRKQPNPAI
jgi:5-methylcytosine-specific restriction endonuclease McrA